MLLQLSCLLLLLLLLRGELMVVMMVVVVGMKAVLRVLRVLWRVALAAGGH